MRDAAGPRKHPMSQIPATMEFVDHGAGGPPSVLHVDRMPVPLPAAGEVLIQVAWAGVNRPDVAQRQGRYPPPAGASPVIGLEVSGHVVALGDGVGGLRVGDAVCALTNGGGYAQYAVTPVGQALPVPRGLSLLQAAALPENFFTVWTNVFERGRLVAAVEGYEELEGSYSLVWPKGRAMSRPLGMLVEWLGKGGGVRA